MQTIFIQKSKLSELNCTKEIVDKRLATLLLYTWFLTSQNKSDLSIKDIDTSSFKGKRSQIARHETKSGHT